MMGTNWRRRRPCTGDVDDRGHGAEDLHGDEGAATLVSQIHDDVKEYEHLHQRGWLGAMARGRVIKKTKGLTTGRTRFAKSPLGTDS